MGEIVGLATAVVTKEGMELETALPVEPVALNASAGITEADAFDGAVTSAVPTAATSILAKLALLVTRLPATEATLANGVVAVMAAGLNELSFSTLVLMLMLLGAMDELSDNAPVDMMVVFAASGTGLTTLALFVTCT